MTMRDPTLAVLNDCFEKRAPGDATRDVTEALEQMDRYDVIDVVEGRKNRQSRVESQAAVVSSVFLCFAEKDRELVQGFSQHLNRAGMTSQQHSSEFDKCNGNFVFLKDLPLLSERPSLTRQTRNLEQTAASAVSAHRLLSSAASRSPSSSPTFVRQRLMNCKFC